MTLPILAEIVLGVAEALEERVRHVPFVACKTKEEFHEALKYVTTYTSTGMEFRFNCPEISDIPHLLKDIFYWYNEDFLPEFEGKSILRPPFYDDVEYQTYAGPFRVAAIPCGDHFHMRVNVIVERGPQEVFEDD